MALHYARVFMAKDKDPYPFYPEHLKPASRYMVKKYGYAKATELALKKHLKLKK